MLSLSLSISSILSMPVMAGEITEKDVAEDTVDMLSLTSMVKYDISSKNVKIRLKNKESFTYTGEEICPEIEVVYEPSKDSSSDSSTEEVVLDPKYYEVQYQNNIDAGTGKIVVIGKDQALFEDPEAGAGYETLITEDSLTVGVKELDFKIRPVNLKNCEIEIEKTMEYTGKNRPAEVTVSYGEKKLATKKDYKVTYSNHKEVGTATATISGIGNYTGTCKKEYAIKPATPDLKISSSYVSNKLTWKKVTGASGYRIYRSTSEKSGFKRIKTCTSGSTISYADTSAELYQNYYYKVVAYRTIKVKVSGKTTTKTVLSNRSEILCGKRSLGRVTVKSAECENATSAKLKWNTVLGASGYQIYASDSKDGKYTRIKTVTGGQTSSIVQNLTSGVQYYFKVRAYNKTGSVKTYGEFSKIKAENFSQGDRLYLLFPDGIPTTQLQMEQYLVTITVPIKDENGVPSTMQLRVHKDLEENFRNAFYDMYEIGFPVRASDTAAFSWRSMATSQNRSHHSYGVVVDLNVSSNPMIGVTSGQYRPGKDPYSITQEVVDIWKKYGFYWGGEWKSTKDYMHLTYTNH